MSPSPHPDHKQVGRFDAAGLLAALALLMPAWAGAQVLSAPEIRKQGSEITAKAKADQAGCLKQAGAARQECMDEARAREKTARAELKAKTSAGNPDKETAAKTTNVRDGRTTIGAGQYGRVTSDGSTTVGSRRDMPKSSAGDLRRADELNKAALPSNQPVDVQKAARGVQGKP